MVLVEPSTLYEKVDLDVAASLVTCKLVDGACYEIGVTVHEGNEGLVKQVVFTPYHILSNLADCDIEACELLASSRSEWIPVPSQQSVPFWPRRTRKLLVFRVAGTDEETLPLSWKNGSKTLLRLNSQFAGIYVEIQVSPSSTVVACHPYNDGRAPLLLINETDAPLTLTESHDSTLATELPANHACFYTLKQPNGSRSLGWDEGTQIENVEEQKWH